MKVTLNAKPQTFHPKNRIKWNLKLSQFHKKYIVILKYRYYLNRRAIVIFLLKLAQKGENQCLPWTQFKPFQTTHCCLDSVVWKKISHGYQITVQNLGEMNLKGEENDEHAILSNCFSNTCAIAMEVFILGS